MDECPQGNVLGHITCEPIKVYQEPLVNRTGPINMEDGVGVPICHINCWQPSIRCQTQNGSCQLLGGQGAPPNKYANRLIPVQLNEGA